MTVKHSRHSKACADCACKPCRNFSADGTRLGSQLAHHFGTKNEAEQLMMAHFEQEAEKHLRLTGMPEEQADWDEGSDDDEGDV